MGYRMVCLVCKHLYERGKFVSMDRERLDSANCCRTPALEMRPSLKVDESTVKFRVQR